MWDEEYIKKALAKPTGEKYPFHISNVDKEKEVLLSARPYVQLKYEQITGKALAPALGRICHIHDYGKLADAWQSPCQKDHKIYLETGSEDEFRFLKNSKFRHEIYSAVYMLEHGYSKEEAWAVAAHHGKLNAAHAHRFEEIEGGEGLLAEMKSQQLEMSMFLSLPEILRYCYELSGLRAYLILADRRASAQEQYRRRGTEEQLPKLVQLREVYKKMFSGYKLVQQRIMDNTSYLALVYRAKAGGGKTFGSLEWGICQIEQGRADRIVIAMPTRFTSNSLAKNIRKAALTGLYHSKSREAFSIATEDDEDAYRYEPGVYDLSKRLETPITVCTVDHLLNAFTFQTEEHYHIFFNLMHSALVVDEADFYDDYALANIAKLINFCGEFKVPVLFMSASLPDDSLKLFKGTYYDHPDRIRFLEIEEHKNDILGIVEGYYDYDIENMAALAQYIHSFKEPKIVYMNTVWKAQVLYDELEKLQEPHLEIYHSRYTELDKLNKEKLLEDLLGESRWTRPDTPEPKGTVILTQIGELSVNISTKLQFSDICPPDRKVQRLGRDDRFTSGHRSGKLIILRPHKKGKLYLNPYTRVHEALMQMMQDYESYVPPGQLTYGSMIDIINQVYSIENLRTPEAIHNADILMRDVINSFIIPSRKARDPYNEDSQSDWKSRNIEEEGIEVMTSQINQAFSYGTEYREHKFANAVQCPASVFRHNLKKERIGLGTIKVDKKNTEYYYLRDPKDYCSRRGLLLGFK